MELKGNILFYLICVNLFVYCDFHNLSGRPGEGYIIEVEIGTPKQVFNVLVDTGSANLAVAAAAHPNIERHFLAEESSSARDLGQKVQLLYTQGRWSGRLVADTVYFPTLNSVPEVTCDIALITSSQGFYMNGSNWQGILGLAYPAIARPSSSVRPWIDSLQKENKDKTIAFSLTLCGPKEVNENQHYGSFEVLNNMLHPYNGLQSATVVHEWFYQIIVTGMHVGSEPLDVSCRRLNSDKAIVDSGTTDVRLPRDVFAALLAVLLPKVAAATELRYHLNRSLKRKIIKNRKVQVPDEFWTQQRTECWSEPQSWSHLPLLSMDLASGRHQYFRINLLGDSYIRQVYDHSSSEFCYKFSIEPSETGTILGVVALEGFQVIFNRSSNSVGFLKSDCGPNVTLQGPFYVESPDDYDLFSECSATEVVRVSLLNIAAYIVCAVLLLASFMFVYLFGQWLKNKYFKYRVNGASVSMSHASLINEDS